jgi:hypothetical protein
MKKLMVIVSAFIINAIITIMLYWWISGKINIMSFKYEDWLFIVYFGCAVVMSLIVPTLTIYERVEKTL